MASLKEVKFGTTDIFCRANHTSPGCSSGSRQERGMCCFLELPGTLVERRNNEIKTLG